MQFGSIIDNQIPKGTNPDVDISGDFPPGECSPYEGYNALAMAHTIYCDIFDRDDFDWIFDGDKSLMEIDCQDVKNLLEAAAYRQLYLRLKTLNASL